MCFFCKAKYSTYVANDFDLHSFGVVLSGFSLPRHPHNTPFYLPLSLLSASHLFLAFNPAASLVVPDEMRLH